MVGRPAQHEKDSILDNHVGRDRVNGVAHKCHDNRLPGILPEEKTTVRVVAGAAIQTVKSHVYRLAYQHERQSDFSPVVQQLIIDLMPPFYYFNRADAGLTG